MKSSHLLSPASAASISASEVKLVLSSWRPFLGHFDNRNVWKWNSNHLRTLWNVASDDLKMASEVKSQESIYFWPQKETKTMECHGLCHSSCKDINLAWKVKQVFLQWIIKNIASSRYEAVEAVWGRQPKHWLSMHKFPILSIPKMNGFCWECHFILKKCWFEVGQSEFKHPVFPRNICFWHCMSRLGTKCKEK